MKNVFGILKDKRTKNQDIDGKVFRVNQISVDHEKELETNLLEFNKYERKSKLPTAFNIIKYISFTIALICIGSLMKAKVSIETAYHNAPYIFYIAGFCLILSAVLFLIDKYKYKKINENSEYQEVIEELEEDIKTSKKQLGIPNDAQQIDVFSFFYKLNKKGKIIIKTSPFFQFDNFPVFVYIRNDSICFSNTYEEFAIPLSSLVEIKKINKMALVSGWYKKEPFTSQKYKKYKIRTNNLGTLIIKPYYSLIINDPIGKFEIFIPNYEIDEIVKLTGLKIIDEDK